MSTTVLLEWTLFLGLSAIALGGSAMMLLTMSMYRAGLFLMVSFLALAGMFFLLEADLLAVIQIMMNVGGMLVMILFMVMLMMDPGGEMMWDMKRQMKLPGPGAFSMSMPRGKPPVAEHPAETEHHHEPASSDTGYTCPMHPQVHSDVPGSCPICGMDLVPRETLSPAAESPQGQEHGDAAKYTCPMHAEVVALEPGNCPKCGMALVPIDASPPAPISPEVLAAAQEYTCPMHPEVRSGKPGSCPECGMDLIAVPPPSSPNSQAETTYTCPMHPEVVSPAPGSCPKCGMDLILDASPTVLPQKTIADPASPDEFTCPMHPEVRSEGPGSCPKCGMDLVPATQSGNGMGEPSQESGLHPMDATTGESGAHRMDAVAHHKMMVDMAMSTEQLPWALGFGLLIGGALTALVLWTPWPAVPRGPVGDAPSAVGNLLLSRYMIAFEGAAMLILAGIAGGVILGRREGPPSGAERHNDAGASTHPSHGDGIVEQQTDSSKGPTGVWTCPMHLEVRSDEPGKCPKCGMNLVPAESLGKQGGSQG